VARSAALPVFGQAGRLCGTEVIEAGGVSRRETVCGNSDREIVRCGAIILPTRVVNCDLHTAVFVPC